MSSSSQELQFKIEVSRIQVPIVKEETICFVARERVNLACNSVSEITGNNHISTEVLREPSPFKPLDLNKGFLELKGENA